MKTVTIQVLQSDIDQGIAGRCCLCPVARAMTRTFGHDCYVGDNCVDIGCNNIVADLPLPQSAQDFIMAFDSGEKVEPFSFELSIPTTEQEQT